MNDDARKLIETYQHRILELEAALRLAIEKNQDLRDQLTGEKTRIWAYMVDRCYEDRGSFYSY